MRFNKKGKDKAVSAITVDSDSGQDAEQVGGSTIAANEGPPSKGSLHADEHPTPQESSSTQDSASVAGGKAR